MPVDAALDADGDLEFPSRLVTGPELTAQRSRVRLRTFAGEWLLDVTRGVPYFRWFAEKPPPVQEIAATVRRELEATPGVVRVVTLSARLDRATQEVRIEGAVQVEDNPDPVSLSTFLGGADGNAHPWLLLLGPSGPILGS